MEISALDKKILNILLRNSRKSFRDIAKELSISAATVITHVKELEKKGIIKRYTTEISFMKLGYEFKAIIEMRISKGKLFESVQQEVIQARLNEGLWGLFIELLRIIETLFEGINEIELLERVIENEKTNEILSRLIKNNHYCPTKKL